MIGEYEPDSRRTFDWDARDELLTRTVRSLARLKREKIGGAAKIFVQGRLLCIERENVALVVNSTEETLTFAGQSCYHVIGARSYAVIDKEGSL